jgi:hypothetical protein
VDTLDNSEASVRKPENPEISRDSLIEPEQKLLDLGKSENSIYEASAKYPSSSASHSDWSLTIQNLPSPGSTAPAVFGHLSPDSDETTTSVLSIENRLRTFFLDAESHQRESYSPRSSRYSSPAPEYGSRVVESGA